MAAIVLYLSVFILSASTLAYEIILSRLFSIAQFYHFAFMTVSLALLGAGASGTALTVLPALRRADPTRWLAWLMWLSSLSMLGSYALANVLPFDSYAIAWDRLQAAYLAVMYLALATPFFFSGLVVGWLLSARPAEAPYLYGVNLAGSAAGCLLAVGALAAWGGDGAATFCAWLVAVAPALRFVRSSPDSPMWGRALGVLVSVAAVGVLSVWLVARPAFLSVRLSPYKALPQALHYPGAERVWTRWNASSRVDLIRSAGIRSFPGLSYAYLGTLPAQSGLTFDGDDLSAMAPAAPGGDDFASYMPGALAYRLRPGARALILNARGGLDAAVALKCGATEITAVDPNDIAGEAVRSNTALGVDARVRWVVDEPRSFVQRSRDAFDVIQVSLSSPYRPVTSGAYSLSEDYDFTVEGFTADLARLNDGGLLISTRWLQTPPSEPLRLYALVLAAAERSGLDPGRSVVALRGYNTVTVIAKRGAWTAAELDAMRDFAATRKFDLVAAPGLRADEANRYNVLRDDLFYRRFGELLAAPDRAAFYAAYDFDVTPPTDNRPFWAHYFKWQQAAQVWAQLGKTWQPFGGAGYYLLVALLVFALITAGMFILLPLAIRGSLPAAAGRGRTLIYFAALGCAFMFVEIPLVQRLILFVGRPVYALAIVLFTLLGCSGLGSLLSPRISWRWALGLLVVLTPLYTWLLPQWFEAALGLPPVLRFALAGLSLAPLGGLMGIPFPKGIVWLQKSPGLIPWAWGVNSAASVIASVLAALIALSVGFTAVLLAGTACYAVALLATLRPTSP